MLPAQLPYDFGQSGARPGTLRDFLASQHMTRALDPRGTNNLTAAACRRLPPPPLVFDSAVLGGSALGDDVAPDPPIFGVELGGATLRQLSVSPPLAGAHPHFHGAAFNALLVGHRRWALVPPARAQFVPQPALKYWAALRYGPRGVDAAADALDEASTAAPWMDAVQRPGEVLYVPADWQHATISLADSVAVAVEFV